MALYSINSEEFTLNWVDWLKRSYCSRLAITLHDLELDNHVSLTLSPSSGGDSSAECTGTVGKYGGLPGVFTAGLMHLPVLRLLKIFESASKKA